MDFFLNFLFRLTYKIELHLKNNPYIYAVLPSKENIDNDEVVI